MFGAYVSPVAGVPDIVDILWSETAELGVDFVRGGEGLENALLGVEADGVDVPTGV